MTEKRRKRENFSQEEKMLIVQFVKENHIIMEDKSSNAKMQTAKKDKWKELAQQMKATGSDREWTELRAAYQRWKVIDSKKDSNQL